MRKSRKLNLEHLEERCNPSGFATQTFGGALLIVDGGVYNGGARSLISVTPGAAAGQVNVNVDGTGYQFSNVPTGTARNPALIIITADANDYVYNGTADAAFIRVGEAGISGAGNSIIYNKAQNSTINAYGQGDTVQATSGNSVITAFGPGAAIFGGTGDNDTLVGSRSVYYNIVGPNTVTLGAGHTGDFINANFAATVNGLNSSDIAATNWFAPGQAPGQFFLQVEGNVIYAVADNAGDTLTVANGTATLTSPTNGTLTVSYGANVNDVAAFGGNGTDTFSVLDTSLSAAMYGQGGPGNTLTLAGGQFGVLKTGATASTSSNGASQFAYSTGAAAGQTGDVLNFTNAAAKHVAFSVNPGDVFTGRVDQLIGVFPT